ncbi:MAG: DUF4145 domain-containing protein [Promethearchaeota archaeon]
MIERINNEKAEEILNEIFNHDECVNRIKEITKERRYFVRADFVSKILRSVMWRSYVYGLFAGCIIISGVCVETALTEELAKKGYSKEQSFYHLINSAKDKRIIEKETAETAHELRELRNEYAHTDIEKAKARVESSGEDLIQSSIGRKEKEKQDAKKALEIAYKILLEIYSEQRYPLNDL